MDMRDLYIVMQNSIAEAAGSGTPLISIEMKCGDFGCCTGTPFLQKLVQLPGVAFGDVLTSDNQYTRYSK
jgi:hypothetical protein